MVLFMYKNKKLKIGLLLGGLSSEREVSLKTGEAIYNALISLGYFVDKIDPKLDNLYKKSKDVDIVFNALHGRFGEDGIIQGFLETIQKPYTGSPVVSSSITMNKVFTKQILSFYQVPIISFKELSSLKDLESIEFDFPMVIKPANEGSSVGISLAKNKASLVKDVKEGLSKYGELLVEPYIKGQEVQVAVLNGKVLGTVEIQPENEFYDYDAKYVSHGTKYLTPANISDTVSNELFEYSKKINDILKCNGVIRIDYIVKENEIFLLEVNTLPGMTSTSLVPKIAKHNGMSFKELVDQIVKSAKVHGI